MTRLEKLVMVAVGLATIAFTCSLLLNRDARAELAKAERAERAAWSLANGLWDDCDNAFSFAKSALASPPDQHQRERVLVAAYAAQVCLDEEARADLRQKVIRLELSGDQNLVRDLALDVVRRASEVIKERHERLRREEEEFDRREREEIERALGRPRGALGDAAPR